MPWAQRLGFGILPSRPSKGRRRGRVKSFSLSNDQIFLDCVPHSLRHDCRVHYPHYKWKLINTFVQDTLISSQPDSLIHFFLNCTSTGGYSIPITQILLQIFERLALSSFRKKYVYLEHMDCVVLENQRYDVEHQHCGGHSSDASCYVSSQLALVQTCPINFVWP